VKYVFDVQQVLALRSYFERLDMKVELLR